MPQGFAELLMYVAPARIEQAQKQWLKRVLNILGVQRLDVQDLELKALWLSPHLLLTQTCGYPLMTELRGKVQVVGRPDYQLPHSADCNHCSLLIAREDDPRQALVEFRGSHGLLNSRDSNSGMNLFRHALAPLQQNGVFFADVTLTGGHRNSLAAIKAGDGDLAAIGKAIAAAKSANLSRTRSAPTSRNRSPLSRPRTKARCSGKWRRCRRSPLPSIFATRVIMSC